MLLESNINTLWLPRQKQQLFYLVICADQKMLTKCKDYTTIKNFFLYEQYQFKVGILTIFVIVWDIYD